MEGDELSASWMGYSHSWSNPLSYDIGSKQEAGFKIKIHYFLI